MFRTKNSVAEKTRQNVINALQTPLANAIDLMLQMKQAHWNIKGPNFIALHELFDQINEQSEKYVDLIAERIAQLGGVVEGTSQAIAKNSSLPEYPLTVSNEREHIEYVSRALAFFGETMIEGIAQVNEWNDVGTADILTEISRSVDKNLWFVESHLPESQVITNVINRAA